MAAKFEMEIWILRQAQIWIHQLLVIHVIYGNFFFFYIFFFFLIKLRFLCLLRSCWNLSSESNLVNFLVLSFLLICFFSYFFITNFFSIQFLFCLFICFVSSIWIHCSTVIVFWFLSCWQVSCFLCRLWSWRHIWRVMVVPKVD